MHEFEVYDAFAKAFPADKLITRPLRDGIEVTLIAWAWGWSPRKTAYLAPGSDLVAAVATMSGWRRGAFNRIYKRHRKTIMAFFLSQARTEFPTDEVVLERLAPINPGSPERLTLRVSRGSGQARRSHAALFEPMLGCRACFKHMHAFLDAPSVRAA